MHYDANFQLKFLLHRGIMLLAQISLSLCSCLDTIVKYKITNEDTNEVSEPTREDYHEIRTQYSSPYLNRNCVQ